MIKRLKKYSLKKHINQSLDNRKLSERNAKLKDLGFLIDEEYYNNPDFLNKLGESFGLRLKDIEVFNFLKDPKRAPSMQQNRITSKEFSWKGEIQNAGALEFIEKEFDVLICIYPDSCHFLNLMAARSKSKFKVGFEVSDKRIFDLILNIDPRDEKVLKTEVKKYLGILNKI